jgi:hypothetical protein
MFRNGKKGCLNYVDRWIFQSEHHSHETEICLYIIYKYIYIYLHIAVAVSIPGSQL